MANPDSIRRREREARAREARLNNEGEEFHETLAAPIPNRTYRSEIDATEGSATTAEQVVRLIATLLNTLLVLRFVVSLFSSDASNGFVSFFYTLTNWMVAPFQAMFGQTPTSGSGFFDWPAIAAIVVVSVVAAILNRILRAPRNDY